jgi:hypothetical protein
MQCNTGRRGALRGLGAGLMAAGLIAGRSAQAAAEPVLALASAQNLRELTVAFAALRRRRDFKTVPMILDNADWWDAAALDAVLGYKGGPKQRGGACLARLHSLGCGLQGIRALRFQALRSNASIVECHMAKSLVQRSARS